MKSYVQLLEACFPGIEANINRSTALGFPWKSKLFLKEENGRVISHVALFEFRLLLENKWVRAGSLHSICTEEAHRKQGHASQLIQEALDWAKNRCEFVILFTSIPKFYERLGFKTVQEHRFHLPCKRYKGSLALRPVVSPNDDALFRRLFQQREPLSNHVWIQDAGTIAVCNTIFTLPTYWSLQYSSVFDGFLSFKLEGKTLHLYDVIASKIPSLDLILDHLPTAIDQIYFYFSPDRLTYTAVAEPHLYDNGHLMIHGPWPTLKPFMISPLGRC